MAVLWFTRVGQYEPRVSSSLIYLCWLNIDPNGKPSGLQRLVRGMQRLLGKRDLSDAGTKFFNFLPASVRLLDLLLRFGLNLRHVFFSWII